MGLIGMVDAMYSNSYESLRKGLPLNNRTLEAFPMMNLNQEIPYDAYRGKIKSLHVLDRDPRWRPKLRSAGEEEQKDVAERLKKMVSPFILRRLKADVLKELPEKVEQIVYVQMEPEQKRIYMALASLKAGGTGLNLTGANIVIHFDPWWNVAAQNQATDRAHRIGQKNPVTVYKLIAQSSIEEKITELQEKKRELADQVLDGEGLSAASLTKEELLEILNE